MDNYKNPSVFQTGANRSKISVKLDTSTWGAAMGTTVFPPSGDDEATGAFGFLPISSSPNSISLVEEPTSSFVLPGCVGLASTLHACVASKRLPSKETKCITMLCGV